MVDGWLNLVKFIVTSFGLPGALAICLVAYMAWLLKLERDDHKNTRDKIDAVNEKRIEVLGTMLKALGDFKISLDALAAMLGGKK